MVEVTATANKHRISERIFMTHLQRCISTKGTSILGLVVRADFLKIVCNAVLAASNITSVTTFNGKIRLPQHSN